MSTPPVIPEPLVAPQPLRRRGAIFGGWTSLIVALVAILVPFPTIWLYVPLILAAFICAIVAISQGHAGEGIALLICSLVLPAITIIAFWTALIGIGGAAAGSTNFLSELFHDSKPQVQANSAYATNLPISEVREVDTIMGLCINGTIQNRGDKPVHPLTLLCTFYDTNGKAIFEKDCVVVGTFDDPIKPNFIHEFQIDCTSVPKQWDTNRFAVRVKELDFGERKF
jgi:hypothetical protein